MSKKPSYLGLLNAIALGEGRAHRYLRAWMEKTPDPEVRQVLATVAIREGEHAMAFEKRLCELGYSLLERPDPSFEKTLDIVTSPRSDLEKFEALGYGKRDRDADDLFSGIFKDRTIDIQTGELLGRYIAEERDSGRRLQACYEALRERTNAASGNGSAELCEIRDGLAALAHTVEKLGEELARLA
ncbi:MAG: hypothetical protein ACE5IL_05185 [Myxococcota bacterium]